MHFSGGETVLVNFLCREGGRVCPRGGDTVLVNSLQGGWSL